jgi:hypothetical protein
LGFLVSEARKIAPPHVIEQNDDDVRSLRRVRVPGKNRHDSEHRRNYDAASEQAGEWW